MRPWSNLQWVVILAISLACFASARTATARTWDEGILGIIRDPPDSRGNSLRFRTYLPEDYDDSQSYPLILYLHPNGQQGTDGNRHVNIFPTPLIFRTFSERPAILIAPQAPFDTSWSTERTRNLTRMLIEQTRDLYSVDDSRLYATGISMGGFGSLDYLNDYLDPSPRIPQFAAVAPLAAGTGFVGDLSDIEPYRDTPIWLFHGDEDAVVDVSLSRDAFRSFTGLPADEPIDFAATEFGHPTAISGNIRYTEIQGGAHTDWARSIYGQTAFYDWLFSQSLPIPEPMSSAFVLVLGSIAVSVGARGHRSPSSPCSFAHPCGGQPTDEAVVFQERKNRNDRL